MLSELQRCYLELFERKEEIFPKSILRGLGIKIILERSIYESLGKISEEKYKVEEYLVILPHLLENNKDDYRMLIDRLEQYLTENYTKLQLERSAAIIAEEMGKRGFNQSEIQMKLPDHIIIREVAQTDEFSASSEENPKFK